MACTTDLISEQEGRGYPAEYQLIRTLDIDNFRCFKSVRLSDIRRFAVVTGQNGGGKTALLEALFVAAGSSPEVYLRAGVWRSGIDEFPLSALQSSTASLFEDFFHQFNVEAGLRIAFKDSLHGDREVRVVPDAEEVLSLKFESKMSESIPSRAVKFFWKTSEGEVESKIEVTPTGVRIPKPSKGYDMILLNQLNYQGAKENAERFSNLSKKNQEQPIIGSVHALFPQVLDLSIQVNAGNVPAIFAHVRGVERKMPLGLLSSGIQKFLSILLAIAAVPHGAVLVDEVESGFHYKLLTQMWEQLMKLCYEKKCQLIATTHSKEFLDAIAPLVKKEEKDFCLLRTERRNGESQILPFEGKEFAAAIAGGFEIR